MIRIIRRHEAQRGDGSYTNNYTTHDVDLAPEIESLFDNKLGIFFVGVEILKKKDIKINADDFFPAYQDKDLKNCPFCNKAAIFHKFTTGWQINCSSPRCGASTLERPSSIDALLAWNEIHKAARQR